MCRLPLLIALTLLAGAAEAQDRERFRETLQRQMEAFDLGASRGVRIVPLQAPAPGADVAPSVPDSGGAAPLASPQGEAAGPTARPADGAPALDLRAGSGQEEPPTVSMAAYAVLAREDQLNIRIRFAFDSAAIAETEKARLRDLCGAVEDVGVQRLRIIGHADATGDAAYNLRLSQRRAEEVRRFFVRDCGIAEGRLEAIGVGKQFPLDEADPYAAENRRVEFQAMS